MKLLLLNSVCGIGSTGRICVEIARASEQNEQEDKITYGPDRHMPADTQKKLVLI